MIHICYNGRVNLNQKVSNIPMQVAKLMYNRHTYVHFRIQLLYNLEPDICTQLSIFNEQVTAGVKDMMVISSRQM